MPRAKPSVNQLAITGKQFFCHGIGNIASRATYALGLFNYFHGNIIDLCTIGHGALAVVAA